MEPSLYQKSPHAKGAHIMDTVSGRTCRYTRISADSSAGDVCVEIPESNHIENHAERDRVIMACGKMDPYRNSPATLQRYGSSEFNEDIPGSNTSLHRRKKCRFIKKSGHCNVSHAHLSDKKQRFIADIFTTCVDLRWRWNLLLFSTAFIISWLVFGLIYWTIAYAHGDFAELEKDRPAQSCVNNLDPKSSFTSAFLFSLETQTTIGYGFRVVTEECAAAIFMVVVQSVFGCVIDAFMIGLIMAKISRPKKRAETLLFSKKAVINVRDGQMCLMVRVGNLRKSHLVEATIRMQYLYSRTTIEGEYIPLEQVDLHLDLKNDSDRLFLVTPQTICHPIDADSPLYHMDKHSLENSDFEIIVILEGMVEATGMTTQARASYLPGEILWGHRFDNVISFSQSNGYHINFKKFDSTYETSDAPSCSAADLNGLMIANGPADQKRRETSGSIKKIREDCSVSDGRDSGYTQVEEEDHPTNSTKTLNSTSSNDSNYSGSCSEAKRRSWTKTRQREDMRRLSEKSDSVFLVAEREDDNKKQRKSSEIAAQITKAQNQKNSKLRAPQPTPIIGHKGSSNQNQNKADVNKNETAVEPTPKIPTAPPLESGEKHILAETTAKVSVDETACLLGDKSKDEKVPTVVTLENTSNAQTNIDSSV